MKAEQTYGTQMPKSFWKRQMWKWARRCVNCGGRGWVFAFRTMWPCPDCHTKGYYGPGELWEDTGVDS
jgi:DnaJ-class molecular chaperone